MMNNIDIIIPLIKGGSKHNNIELKYALRSIEKHLTGYRDIIIITNDTLDWIQEAYVVWLPTSKLTKTKDIKKKIEFACNPNINVSEVFLFTNDDIFLLEDCDAREYPFYYSTKAQQEIADRKNTDIYKRIMLDTDRVLCESGKEDFKYFDIHSPIRYNKLIFSQILNRYDWNNRYGYLIKSLYANNLRTTFVEIDDCVLREPLTEDINVLLKDKKFFTLDNNKKIDTTIQRILNDLYPNKSKYEK